MNLRAIAFIQLCVWTFWPIVDVKNPLTAQDPDPTQKKAVESLKRIEVLISELGSPKFSVREQASRSLWNLGKAAEDSLRVAAENPNAEIAERARSILADFDYGIYPTTDAATKELILRFRDGKMSQKKSVSQQLLLSGQTSTLIKLFLKDNDPARMAPLIIESFGNSRFARKLIEKGDSLAALESLRLLNQHSDDLKFNSFRREELRAEYLWLASIMNQLAPEAQKLRVLEAKSSKSDRQLLGIRLHRAMGNVEECLKAAAALTSSDLSKEVSTKLLVEKHDWKTLSEKHWNPDRQQVSELEIPELLAGLIFHRLAGNTNRFESDLRKLFEFSDSYVDEFALTSNSGLFEKVTNLTIDSIIEFLLTNQQSEKALEYLAKIDRFRAFDACVAMDDHRRAFEALGLKEITPATLKILDRQIRLYQPVRWSDSTEDIEKLTSVVYALYQLGYFEESKSLYRTLYSIATRYEANQTGALSVVCRSLLANDQKELFFELIETQIQQKNTDFAIESLFEDLSGNVDGVSLASFWWTVFDDEFTDKPAVERLRLLDKYLRPLLPGEKPDAEFQNIVSKIEKEFSKGLASWGDEAFLGYTFLLWNDRDNAKKWLSKYDFETSPSSSVALDLGDLYFEDKQFDLAAATYLKAWRFGNRQPAGLYLAGIAQREAGMLERSEQTISLAKKLILSTEHNREVASALMERDQDKDARKILETAMKVGEMQSWEVGTARFRLINLLDENDGNFAANLLEQQLYDVVATTRFYPSVASYTYFPMEVQLRIFDQMVAEGKPKPASQAIRKALQFRPCSATIAEDYLPKLKNLPDGKELADELFESIRKAHHEQLKLFPNSGLYNNNLAWINSTNKVHLDEALKHAELAVKNEPDNPTYMDTLADVCFNLGQVDRAISLMEKCLKLNPRSEHYSKQIKRFRAHQASKSNK